MSHPPPYDLERLSAGALGDDEASALAHHMARCPDCQNRLNRIEEEQRTLLARKSPELFALQVAEGLARNKPARMGPPYWRWTLSGAAVAAAAVIIILLLPPSPTPTGELRWMGKGVAVKLYLNRNGSNSIYNQQPLRGGDRLRYEVTLPTGKRAFAILIGEAGGKFFPLLPPRRKARAFKVSGALLLPGSVVIEPGGGPVHLWLIARSGVYSVASVLEEIDSLKKKNPGRITVPGRIHELTIDLDNAK